LVTRAPKVMKLWILL